MNFIEQLRLLQRFDSLIARRGTGSAKELASKFGISRSSIFNYLDTLRQLGADIEYCEQRKSYYYVNNKRPHLPTMSQSDSEKFHAGKIYMNIFQDSPEFLDWHISPLYHVERQEEKHHAGNCGSFWLGY